MRALCGKDRIIGGSLSIWMNYVDYFSFFSLTPHRFSRPSPIRNPGPVKTAQPLHFYDIYVKRRVLG
jgi:hypothetical protein